MNDPFDLSSKTPMPEPLHLQDLNESQREAVETVNGPVLMLAGAGTGKTRALTTRLAHILTLRLARPHEILAVTFTNKAAREMRERVATLIGHTVEGWWIGTFHALGARILRAHAELAGLKPNFTILDIDDQIRLVKQLLKTHGIDAKHAPPRAVLGEIQRWKDRGLTPDKITGSEDSGLADGRVPALYQDYQDRLQSLNAADFGDLLMLCLALFQKAPNVLDSYRNQFRYLLVDEYQDTNVAQYLWLRLLAAGHRNICCVGDDDQSIYSWRGAEVGNILRFEQDFPGARVIRLERNYRSTSHILGAASGLIANNTGRLGKTLWTEPGDEGRRVGLRGVWDGEQEAQAVSAEIEAMTAKGYSLSKMAVLVRAGFQTREFEERLVTLGIPYRVIGGPRFYERQEIRDAIAYLRVIAQPSDDLAFERVINVPKRGIGPAALKTVYQAARAGGAPLAETAQMLVETGELQSKPRQALADLMAAFKRWRDLLSVTPHFELAALMLEESGYAEMWRLDTSPDAPGRLENLKEFTTALEEFDSLEVFLEHVALVMENDEAAGAEKVSLMTLHAAKGLEFDVVFLPGWEEGLFPHQRAMNEGGVAALEEERRLAYVGITRARKCAFISFCAHRRVYGQWQSTMPSRVIDELPEKHVDRISATGVYGGGRSGRFTLADHHKKSPIDAYKLGQRIFHQKFGYGRILSADSGKLEVSFDKAGVKKVIESFVEPA